MLTGPDDSTQVSLLPPPFAVVTTKVSAEEATRVSPPGITVKVPSEAARKPRRSMCRGSSRPPTSTGVVDSATLSWPT